MIKLVPHFTGVVMVIKRVLISLLSLSSAVFANEYGCEVRQNYGYGSVGGGPLPLPVPTFTLGYRNQVGHHGLDLSLQAATIGVITQVKTNLLYHHYFDPNPCSQTYMGAGIGPSYLFGEGHALLLSPEFVVGNQYQTETGRLRFFQAQVSFPTVALGHGFHHRHEVLKYPLMVISYGFGF
jgi:hypothetical protein